MENSVCTWCDTSFPIDKTELEFYKKIEVPIPTKCPDCRQLLRTLHVNQINLFKTKCYFTKKDIICGYPPETPFKIVSQEYWHSDNFDAIEYGREYNFTRTFFEQFYDLKLSVPRLSLFTDYSRDINSDYTNFAGMNKNCYLIFDSDENRDCYYSYSINSCTDCMECHRVEQSELCYNLVDCRKCYNCCFLYNSETCIDSAFLNNCIGCKNCIMCSNLKQKENYLFNNPVSKSEITSFKAKMSCSNELKSLKELFKNFIIKFPQKDIRGFQNEKVFGNYLTNCKNAYRCFDSRGLWDVAYGFQAFMPVRSSQDFDQCGDAELLYQCSNLGYNAYNIKFSMCSLTNLSNLTYCDLCFNGCSDLFGCIGLKKKEYCILNKQYSKEDYLNILPKIIEKMKSDNEWGEFFPANISSVPYNLSVAYQYNKLSKEQALQSGFLWRDEETSITSNSKFLDEHNINKITKTICNEIFSCKTCRKNYKIISQELTLLQKLSIPPSEDCFHCRHQKRIEQRCKRKLWKRKCESCAKDMEVAYDINSQEIVFCEECYQRSLI